MCGGTILELMDDLLDDGDIGLQATNAQVSEYSMIKRLRAISRMRSLNMMHPRRSRAWTGISQTRSRCCPEIYNTVSQAAEFTGWYSDGIHDGRPVYCVSEGNAARMQSQ